MPLLRLDYSHQPTTARAAVLRLLRRAKAALIAVAVMLALYIGSYLVFSMAGHFEPGPSDVNGIMWDDWAPAVLISGFKHRWPLIFFYAPLMGVDRQYWHQSEDAKSGRYPVRIPSNAVEWAEFRK